MGFFRRLLGRETPQERQAEINRLQKQLNEQNTTHQARMQQLNKQKKEREKLAKLRSQTGIKGRIQRNAEYVSKTPVVGSLVGAAKLAGKGLAKAARNIEQQQKQKQRADANKKAQDINNKLNNALWGKQ